MPREYPEGLVVIRGPQPGRPVVPAGGEVVAHGRELHIPNGQHVPLVHHQTRPDLQAPQPNRRILRATQKQSPVGGERDRMHRTAVAEKRARNFPRTLIHHPHLNIQVSVVKARGKRKHYQDVFGFDVDVLELLGGFHGFELLGDHGPDFDDGVAESDGEHAGIFRYFRTRDPETNYSAFGVRGGVFRFTCGSH